jgi:hypothetical protein
LAIYRGPGGSGDAVNDAASEVLLALAAKNAAVAAQAAAEAAQVAAELAETNAETAETNAETAETNAETAETNAETAQAAAASSASAASTSATNAAASASTATTQATNAASSASSASTSASNASTSASAASTSASNASTSASNAATSATNATNAQTAAETARDQTLTAYDNFDDRYLGSKTSDPSLDNDGNALVAGSLYFNSVSGAMKVYTGSAWVDAYSSGTTFLTKANNLSDLTNTSTARTNLGLAIGTNVQAYDAQLADVAGLTPTDNNFIVGNGTNFVTESGSTARTSLGLGSIATQDSSNVTITGGSISGITDLAVADGGTGASDAAGARTNLGLVIGTNVQAYDADLATIAGLTPTNNYAIIGNGTSWTSSALPASGVTSVTGTSPISSSGGATPAISLDNSGVTANTYGSSSSIPVITVSAKGLLTSVTTATVAGGQYFGTAASKAIAYNEDSIAENITTTSGKNCLSVGPITISSGYTVTIASGQRWVVL